MLQILKKLAIMLVFIGNINAMEESKKEAERTESQCKVMAPKMEAEGPRAPIFWVKSKETVQSLYEKPIAIKIKQIQFSCDKTKLIIVTEQPEKVKIFDLNTSTEYELPKVKSDTIGAISKDGNFVATAHKNNIILWDANTIKKVEDLTKKVKKNISKDAQITKLDFDENNNLVATTKTPGKLSVEASFTLEDILPKPKLKCVASEQPKTEIINNPDEIQSIITKPGPGLFMNPEDFAPGKKTLIPSSLIAVYGSKDNILYYFVLTYPPVDVVVFNNDQTMLAVVSGTNIMYWYTDFLNNKLSPEQIDFLSTLERHRMPGTFALASLTEYTQDKALELLNSFDESMRKSIIEHFRIIDAVQAKKQSKKEASELEEPLLESQYGSMD
jgi:WD40 repeat protein